jgi:hypothetical protein
VGLTFSPIRNSEIKVRTENAHDEKASGIFLPLKFELRFTFFEVPTRIAWGIVVLAVF